jgi:hypothetical protein
MLILLLYYIDVWQHDSTATWSSSGRQNTLKPKLQLFIGREIEISVFGVTIVILVFMYFSDLKSTI